MHVSVDDKMRNYILMAVISMTIAIIMITSIIAAHQDKTYRDNYYHYQQASQLMKQQKYAEAQQVLTQLDADSRSSFQVLYMQALCAENLGDYPTALQMMQKVSETRPAFLREQNYLEEYGVILYRIGDYERAQLYLQESLKYPNNAVTVQEARDYLAEIDETAKLGR